MLYAPEGLMNTSTTFTPQALQCAKERESILQARAMLFDTQKQLRLTLGGRSAVIPLQEAADGAVRDSAALACVGRTICFTVQDIPQDPSQPLRLSRAVAQRICKAEYIDRLQIGDIIPCRVTHLENFGAFCDVGCGIAALLPIDCMSVSRIRHPADRVRVAQTVRCAVKSRDELGRLVLTLKELLGTWQENAACFCAGETAVGIVRSVEPYGVFVELAPNLAGLAEYSGELQPGQTVSVYIKSIVPERHKIKLAILRVIEGEDIHFPLHYFVTNTLVQTWQYLA